MGSSCRCTSASPPSTSASARRRGSCRISPARPSSEKFGLAAQSAEAYALTDQDYVELAKRYGRMGGLDRIATVVKSIRAERPGRTLLLDGGDTWTNSWTALQTKGQDMVEAMGLLAPDAMTGHWEFTLGAARVKEIVDGCRSRSWPRTCAIPSSRTRSSPPPRCSSAAG